jgi:hypothetical protein
MQRVTLQIDDNFYNHFMELIKNISKVKVVENDFPQELLVSSVEEVRKRVYKSEQSKGLTQEEYDEEMDKFFKNELGIVR